MTRKRLLMLLGSICLAVMLALAGCPAPTPTPTTPELPKITWKFSSSYSATDDLHSKVYQPVWDRVFELTNGGLEIINYPGAELHVDPEDALYLVKEGTPPIVEFFSSRTEGVVAAHGVIHLPFLLYNAEEAEAVLNATFPIISRDLEENWNSKLLFSSPRSIHIIIWSKEPIPTVEDLRGKKIRVYSGIHADILTAAGAVPVTLSMAEVYGALQRGMIDGAITSPSTAASDHYDEVLGYCNEFPIRINTDTGGASVNLDVFNALPQEYQDALVQAGRELMERSYKISKLNDQVMKDDLKSKGIEFIPIAEEDKVKMEKLAKPAWDEVMEQGGALAEEIMAVVQKTLKELRA
ncbi:Lactate-binding periplasmic protein [subsurface metagenome]